MHTTEAPLAPTTFPAGMGSPDAADGVFPRTVHHFAGSATLTAMPQRLAVLATGELDAALCLGLVPVASTSSNFSDGVPRYLQQRFADQTAALQAIVEVGPRTAPDVQRLAAAQPDLIVGTFAGVHGRMAPALAAIAPTVLMGGHGFNWKQDFLLLAEALGRRSAAQGVMAAYHARAAHMRAQWRQSQHAGETVSFARLGPKGLEVYGRHAFIDTIARDVGLLRPASQAFDAPSQNVVPDRVAEIDADWLFYSEVTHPAAQQARAAIDPQWQALTALQRGRAVCIDADPWHGNAGPVAALVVLDDLAAALQLH